MLILLIFQKRLISESLGKWKLSRLCVCVCVLCATKVCCQESACGGLGILKGSVTRPNLELVILHCRAHGCLETCMKSVRM